MTAAASNVSTLKSTGVSGRLGCSGERRLLIATYGIRAQVATAEKLSTGAAKNIGIPCGYCEWCIPRVQTKLGLGLIAGPDGTDPKSVRIRFFQVLVNYDRSTKEGKEVSNEVTGTE
ncbi:hypothetical protein SAY87_001722 [Trapa incisa]|uniref:Uncharacterized protein n=1 Tax=Trapa incisa TaxID=236973 RepID=A0AAN7PTX7_9MYRT|nr:hypothetical protein SAY87_001722 [Trapa incisa]